QSKPKITLVVTSFLPEINSSVILTNEVVESCMDRLGLSSAFDIAREDQMNRKEAIDKAKGMKSGYLLYMELDLDTADRDLAGIGPQDYSNLYVWYMLYEAQTGKIKTQGHVYQRPAYNGVPVPTTQGNIEYPLQQAGRETADRIMQAVGVALPPGH
ncbi:MAG TPA: hypothetical protein VEZ90_08720, partial [Blastocatellia bacterium]|nr:hypothetical protein [Blastocatellia bacterium]